MPSSSMHRCSARSGSCSCACTSCAPRSGQRPRPRWCTRALPGRSPSSCSRPTAGRSSASARPTETRYGYIAIILLAPAVAMALDRLLRRASTPFRAVFVVVFLMLVVARTRSSSATTRPRGGARAAGPRARFSRLRRSRTIRRRSSRRMRRPEPHYSPDLTVADLRRFGANGELPALRPSLERQLTAAANLQIGLAKADALAACPAPPVAQSTLLHARPRWCAGRGCTARRGPWSRSSSSTLRRGRGGAAPVHAPRRVEPADRVPPRGGREGRSLPPNAHVCPGAAGRRAA